MNIEKIIEKIAPCDSEDYHCYDTLRMLLSSNKEFYELIVSGINNNMITGFDEELWNKLNQQNLRAPNVKSFLEVLRDGYNQGYCTVASKQVSYSFNSCFICGGIFPLLIGTNNCPEGDHTWIEYNNKIYDTTLMLAIDKSLKSRFGYIEENRYNPNKDPSYLSAKNFTNDKSIKQKEKEIESAQDLSSFLRHV